MDKKCVLENSGTKCSDDITEKFLCNSHLLKIIKDNKSKFSSSKLNIDNTHFYEDEENRKLFRICVVCLDDTGAIGYSNKKYRIETISDLKEENIICINCIRKLSRYGFTLCRSNICSNLVEKSTGLEFCNSCKKNKVWLKLIEHLKLKKCDTF